MKINYMDTQRESRNCGNFVGLLFRRSETFRAFDYAS